MIINFCYAEKVLIPTIWLFFSYFKLSFCVCVFLNIFGTVIIFRYFILLFSFFLFCLFDQIPARVPRHRSYQREHCAMATVSIPSIPPLFLCKLFVGCVLCPERVQIRPNGKVMCDCPRVSPLKTQIGFRLNFVLGESTLTPCHASLMFVCISLSIFPEAFYHKKILYKLKC